MTAWARAGQAFGRFFNLGDPENPPPLERNPWFWAVVVMLLFPPLLQLTGLTRRIPDPPEAVTTLPAFSLVDQDGRPFTNADLGGKVHVVGMFFSSCTASCPRLLGVMQGIAAKVSEQAPYSGVGDDLQMLGITVDPETDTPERLKALMAERGLDPARWTLLTGDPEAVRSLVVGGFKLAVGEKVEQAPGAFDIAHSDRLAIVDGAGGVRGFYGLEAVGAHTGLTGQTLGSDFDGPEAIRAWAEIVLKDQRRRADR